MSALGCWVVTLCSWLSARERLEHSELLLGSFLKERVGLIIGMLSSHFSKSHFVKEPRSLGISHRRLNPLQPPGIRPTEVLVAKSTSRLGA